MSIYGTLKRMVAFLFVLALSLTPFQIITAEDQNPTAIRQGTLLLEDGTPGSFALITFYAADGSAVLSVSNRKGEFSFDALFPGSYLMVISTRSEEFGYIGILEITGVGEPAILENHSNYNSVESAALSSGEVTYPLVIVEPFVITLQATGSISGIVPPCGTECAVVVSHQNVVLEFENTDDAGYFTFNNIVPGYYDVIVYGNNWSKELSNIRLSAAESIELNLNS